MTATQLADIHEQQLLDDNRASTSAAARSNARGLATQAASTSTGRRGQAHPFRLALSESSKTRTKSSGTQATRSQHATSSSALRSKTQPAAKKANPGDKPAHSNSSAINDAQKADPNRVTKALELPPLGQPGAKDDPRRKGLSGAGCRWYMRYLNQGLSPDEARAKALEHKQQAATVVSAPTKRDNTHITPPTANAAKKPREAGPAVGQAPKQSVQQQHTGKTYAKVAGSIRIVILPVDYPAVLLQREELTRLEELLVEEIGKGWSVKLRFDGIAFRPGMLVVDCKDKPTADWLKEQAPQLSEWKGAPLKACLGVEVPPLHTIRIFCPRSAGQEPSKLLKLLDAQNDGLRTDIWRVFSNIDEPNGQLLTLGIDEMSARSIAEADHKLNFRFSSVTVYGLKKSERDKATEAAATTPPEQAPPAQKAAEIATSSPAHDGSSIAVFESPETVRMDYETPPSGEWEPPAFPSLLDDSFTDHDVSMEDQELLEAEEEELLGPSPEQL